MSFYDEVGPGSRVVLLNPPIADTIEAERMDMITAVLPFGLLRLGEYFRRRGCEVILLDALRHPCLEGRLRRYLRKTLPCGEPSLGRQKDIWHYGLEPAMLASLLAEIEHPDLIAVSSIFTWHIDSTRETLRICKETHPESLLVVGGNLPTVCPEAFDGCAADLVFEGDIREAVFLPPALDLEQGPPSIDCLRLVKGCPHSCSYCITNRLNDGRVQASTPEAVFAQMQGSAARFGLRNFLLYDDFVLYRYPQFLKPFLTKVAEEGGEAIVEFPLGFSAHMITDELAELLRRARVQTVILALETISDQRSRHMARPNHIPEFLRAVEILRAHGYHGKGLRAFLLMGLPGQTLDEILRGILFLLHQRIMPSLTTYALTPGSGDFSLYAPQAPYKELDELGPGLWRFAHEGMPSLALEQVYRYFHERYFPLERIQNSVTDDPVIRRMQELIRQGRHLPESF